jgi:hypothetical protein
MHFRQN